MTKMVKLTVHVLEAIVHQNITALFPSVVTFPKQTADVTDIKKIALGVSI